MSLLGSPGERLGRLGFRAWDGACFASRSGRPWGFLLLLAAFGGVVRQPVPTRGRASVNLIVRLGPRAGRVGAHYDAFGEFGDNPGADDNASGTGPARGGAPPALGSPAAAGRAGSLRL